MYLKEVLKYYKYLAIPTIITIVVVFYIYNKNIRPINAPETKLINGLVYENTDMSIITNQSEADKIRNREAQAQVKILTTNNNTITLLDTREACFVRLYYCSWWFW